MAVQIIMPNLNYGQFIGEAIQSVLDQTYQDWELHICDGGSTDNSLDIISNVKDSRTFLHHNKLTPSARMSETAKLSKSKYIVLLASDDKIMPKFLEENVRVMENMPTIDFVYNSYVDVKDNIITLHPHHEYIPNRLMEYYYMGVFWMVKRSLWEEVGGTNSDVNMDKENPIPFDYDFCLRCEETGACFKYLDKSLGWYREWQGSDTGRHSPEWLAKVGENARALARQRRGL